MKAFNPYSIEFVNGDDAEPQLLKVYAANIGHAFQKCAEKFPQAKMLRGFRWGYLNGGWVCIQNDAPSTAKVEPLPASDGEERTFAFFDDCIGERPFNHRK